MTDGQAPVSGATGSSYGAGSRALAPIDGLPVISADAGNNEIIFMVQVASASARTEISPASFRGLTDIIEIHSQERYKYATGRFGEYADAVKYRRQIEQIYPDAFVIALKNNKILPLQQALDLKRKK